MKYNQKIGTNFIEIEAVSTDPEVQEKAYPENEGSGLLLTFTAYAFITLTLALVGRIFQNRIYHKKRKSFIQFKEPCHTPCMNCRFFHNKSHHKCAIHPSRVLRQEAANCSDYWGQDSSNFARR